MCERVDLPELIKEVREYVVYSSSFGADFRYWITFSTVGGRAAPTLADVMPMIFTLNLVLGFIAFSPF